MIDLRRTLAHDPHRPRYHFLPPAHWINDPNGMIFWGEQYHLFYQYNPNGAFHGTIHWGHAVSDDLVHWRDLPVALVPTPGGPDAEGCWSGCTVDNDGVPTIFYTGVAPERQCIATGSPDLITWHKYAGNPVIAGPPEGLHLDGFRDPWVWHENGTWYMVLGTGIVDQGGAVLFYRSADLLNWDYVGLLFTSPDDEPERIWECPSVIPWGERRLLFVSVMTHERTDYYVGTIQDHCFIPEQRGQLDFGRYFYAPQTLLDGQNRRVMMAWVLEGRDPEIVKQAGWAGAHSLPRVLSAADDGTLRITPAPELRMLRGAHTAFTGQPVAPDSTSLLPDVAGDCLEILAEIEPGDAETVGIRVRCAPDGAEYTPITYTPSTGHLTVDPGPSSLSPGVDREAQVGTLTLAAGEPLRLHIFVDRSVIEVFANDGRACITCRVYPSRRDSLGVGLVAHGGPAQVRRLDIWEMGSIWE